jgi:hypothetical protein
MDEMTYTVTLTAKELAFRKRAREAGIPAIVVSMYVGALQRLVEDEREECAKVCEEQMKAYMSSQYTTDPLGGFRERFAAERCAVAIRARGEK